MSEFCQEPGFSGEELAILLRQVPLQHLDRCPTVEIDMFSQIDFRKAPTPQETEQAVIPKLLANTIEHIALLPQHSWALLQHYFRPTSNFSPSGLLLSGKILLKQYGTYLSQETKVFKTASLPPAEGSHNDQTIPAHPVQSPQGAPDQWPLAALHACEHQFDADAS